MLAKKYRLAGGKSFKEVQDHGKVFQSDNFGIAYLERGDSETSRFGFIVSTKVAREAVDRNRIKRALSEAVRRMGPELVDGYNVVFLAKTSIMRVPTDVAMKEVKSSLILAGLANK